MNDQSAQSDASPAADPLSPGKARLSGEALARRRLLLRGASGSAAALAALKPMGAMATGTVVLICKGVGGNDGLCTLSGVQSGVHSFGPNTTKYTAAGKATSYWAARSGSGPGTPTRAWPTVCQSTCAPGMKVSSLLSGCASAYTNVLMLDLLNNSVVGSASSIEADFIVAYLNAALLYSATGPTATMTFPYSKEQVKGFWDAGDAAPNKTRSRARTLFQAIDIKTS